MHIQQRNTFSSYTQPISEAEWYWWYDVMDNDVTVTTDGILQGGPTLDDYIDLGGEDGWLILT